MPKIDCAADAIRAAANGAVPLQYSNHSAERLSIYPLLDSRLPPAEFAATPVTLDAAKTARLQAMLNAAAQEADEAWPLERQKALRALYRANLSSCQQKALDPHA